MSGVAGELRHLLRIQIRTKTPDGQGGYTYSWADSTTVWAQLEPIDSEIRAVDAIAMSGEITHRIRIRYRTGISKANRLRMGSRYFEIVRPPLNWRERDEFLDLYAKELVVV